MVKVIRPNGRRSNLLGKYAVRQRMKRKIRKQNSLQRRAISPLKPVRSARKPVNVLFLCDFHGLSSVQRQQFDEIVKQKKIDYIQTNAVAAENLDAPTRLKMRQADIAVFLRGYNGQRRQELEQLSPNARARLDFSRLLNPDFSMVFNAINEHFTIKKRK